MQSVFLRTFDQPPERVLTAVGEAAEIWGGAWRPAPALGGQLDLPVIAGLRRGVVRASVILDGSPTATSLRLEVEESRTGLNKSALAVLCLGAMGGLTLVFWPLSPRILQLAPIGAVLAIVAWLLVVSRLRYGGVDDFLDLVGTCLEGPDE